MSEWRATTWGEVSKLRYGKSLKDYRNPYGEVRVFGTNGPVGWVSGVAPLARGPRAVVGRKGAYRGVHLAVGEFWVIDTAYWLEPGDQLDPTFSYYKLLTVDINGMDSGSAIPSLSREHLAALPLTLPPLSEQRRIAAVLGALDDLIETNRALVSRSIELAKSTILRAVVDGERVCVADVAEVRRGLSYKGAGLADTGVPMVNMGSAAPYGWLKRGGWKHYQGDYKPRHLAKSGDLILTNTEQTWRQEILGWPMLVPADVPEALFTHHTYLVDFLPEHRRLRLALWAQLFSPSLRAAIDGSVRGTTVANLPVDAVKGLHFRVPADGSLAVDAAEALLHSVWADELEIANLTRTRDELLPLLMSGRVRVEDVEGAA